MTLFLTTLGGWLLYNQRFDYKFLIDLAIASIGTIILGFDDLQVASVKLQADLLALLSPLLGSANLLTIKKLRTQLIVTSILTWVYRIVTLLFAVVLFTTYHNWFPDSGNGCFPQGKV